MSNVTVADIARHLGVSTATVSMTLRNKGRISEHTRQRVLKAIDELGYVYNQTAANLRNKSSNQVGLLLHDITNPFYAEMTAGLSREMEHHDLMLFLANSEESAARQQQFMDSLQRNSAAGMVICRRPAYPPQLFREPATAPYAHHSGGAAGAGCGDRLVGTDNFLGCQLATEHLIRLGHRHIAFIGGATTSISRSQRLGGYMSKLLEHGITAKPEWIISCGASRVGRHPRDDNTAGAASGGHRRRLLSRHCGTGRHAGVAQTGSGELARILRWSGLTIFRKPRW